jgi:hypothetical protein
MTTIDLTKLTDAEIGSLVRAGAITLATTTPAVAKKAAKKGRVTRNSEDARARTAAAEAKKAARPTPEFIVRRGANKALNRAAAEWSRTPEGVKACEGLDWDGIKAAYQANA